MAVRTRNGLFGCLTMLMAAANSANATDRTWLAPAGGFFSEPAKWSGGVVPGTGDRAIFNQSSTYTVAFVSNPTNDRLRISNDTVTFNLGGLTYNLTSLSSPSVSVGGNIGGHGSLPQNGRLTLMSGTLRSNSAAIGTSVQGSGKVTVSTGATWNNSQVLSVGEGTSGTLEIVNGGRVTGFSGILGDASSGTATVSGSGSIWTLTSSLDVGGNDTGALNIQSGGKAACAILSVGTSTGVTGTATVNGANSRWECSGSLSIGNLGHGTLNVTNGGFVYNSNLNSDNRIGDQFGSTGSVTINSGSWSNLGKLSVGYLGAGTLNLQNGAVASSHGNSYLAYSGSSTATATISGTNSTWSSFADMYIGGNQASAGGNGTLTINPGGKASATGLFKVWAPGTVNLGGGTVQATNLQINGGTFNWTTGSLILGSDMTVGSGGVLGSSLAIGTGRNLQTLALTVGDAGLGALTVAGGGSVVDSTAYIGSAAAGNGSVMVEGSGSTWTNNSPITVGRAGAGSLTISNGGKVLTFPDANYAQSTIADLPGSHGSVVVDGAGSSWELGAFGLLGDLYVGKSGTGTLEIRNGGQVKSNYGSAVLGFDAGSSGAITVRGAGSQWLVDTYSPTVGWSGSGTLNVLEGGLVDLTAGSISGSTIVGYLAPGALTVDGAGSEYKGGLTIGDGAPALLNITNGGSVDTSNLYTTAFPEAQATIALSGVGSSLACSGASGGQLIVAGTGPASMTISGGATATALETFIGDGNSAVGDLLVTGAGSLLTSTDELDVGFFGNGTLTIQAGATVSSGTSTIGYGISSTGAATLSGANSQWNISDQLRVGGGVSGQLTVATGGALTISSALSIQNNGVVTLTGGQITASSASIAAGGRLNGVGMVTASVQNGGTVSPGNSPGLLSITGNFTQIAGGTLAIELGGPIAGAQYDRLAVSGGATLAGKLSVSLIDGFVPAPGAKFQIVLSGSSAGQFQTIEFTDFPAGMNPQLLYAANGVSVVIPGCDACDTTCDGSVNQFDIQGFVNALATHSGCSPCAGDINGDGSINQFDIQGFVQCLAH